MKVHVAYRRWENEPLVMWCGKVGDHLPHVTRADTQREEGWAQVTCGACRRSDNTPRNWNWRYR